MPGVYRLGPEVGTLRVLTFKAGFLRALGHDLILEARAWSGALKVESAEPARARLEVEVSASSLLVVAPEDLSQKDRAEIHDHIRADVLRSERHPKIRFTAERFEVRRARGGAERLSAWGALEIVGARREVLLESRLREAQGMLRAAGEIALRQSDFGIKPYRAPLGVLRVKDEVRIAWDLALPLRAAVR